MLRLLLPLLLMVLPSTASAECALVTFADALQHVPVALGGRVVSSSNESFPKAHPSKERMYVETTFEVEWVYKGSAPKLVRLYQGATANRTAFENAIGETFIIFAERELTAPERDRHSVPPNIPAFMIDSCASKQVNRRDLQTFGTGRPPKG